MITRSQALILILSTLPVIAVNAFIYLPSMLIPLWEKEHVSLSVASSFAGATALGMTATLVLWGWFTDRCGERLTLTIGLGITAIFALMASMSSGPMLFIALLLGGAGAASANAASGRLVVGYFPPNLRGKAMGVRQTAQPLGVACAAVLTVVIRSPRADFQLIAGICLVMSLLCFLLIQDPHHPISHDPSLSTINPYLQSWYLPRLHLSSVLLQVPQTLSWTFTLVWLESSRHWDHQSAALAVLGIQILGACGRIISGHISDVLKTRIGLIKIIAMILTLVMLILAFLDWIGSPWAYVAIVLLGIFSVADNGLAFTAVVERAGPSYSGRALGIQNTGQLLISFLAASAIGNALSRWNFSNICLFLAIIPLLAICILPKNDTISA